MSRGTEVDELPVAAVRPVAACAEFGVLAAMGDPVAMYDCTTRRLAAASDTWRAVQPGLGVGASRTAIEAALPGFADGLGADAGSPPTDIRVGPAREWGLRLARIDRRRVVLRLTDQREQGRVLQRQLDDREQLLFTSRVVSVGEMAATLAHELNQPIGAAANLLRGLRARLSRRAGRLTVEEMTALDQAIDQLVFSARIIARIREFTHSRQPRHVPLDLAALLRESAALLDWDLQRTRALLALELPPAPVTVRGDSVMLQQVIVNLMRNALDALRTDPPADPALTLGLLVREREVEVRVSDNGCGLSDEAEAKLFVPFASSKPNGTGIGLLICRSFIEQHQGRLWFSRNEQRGATFHVTLPRALP
jgi:two-component system sensor kinase FixL